MTVKRPHHAPDTIVFHPIMDYSNLSLEHTQLPYEKVQRLCLRMKHIYEKAKEIPGICQEGLDLYKNILFCLENEAKRPTSLSYKSFMQLADLTLATCSNPADKKHYKSQWKEIYSDILTRNMCLAM